MNVPLRVGLIGCGHIAGVHMAAWRRTGLAEIQCVYDVNPALAQSFAARFGIASVASSFDGALDHVDVVDDCSPPAAHLSNALRALEAGRHYLVEKPIVVTKSELDQILLAREIARKEICVIHNLKYNQAVQMAKQWVDQGRIGNLLSLERHLLTDASTDRMLRTPHHWSSRLPGGRWTETLPHELYLTYHFLGALELDSVTAVRVRDPWDGQGTPEEVAIVLKGGHSLATIRYSSRCRINRRSLVLYGTDGIVHVDILAGSARCTRHKDGLWARGVGLDALDALATLGGWIPDRVSMLTSRARGETSHAKLIAQFANYLLGEDLLPVSVDEIAYVVSTTEAIGRHFTPQMPIEDRADWHKSTL